VLLISAWVKSLQQQQEEQHQELHSLCAATCQCQTLSFRLWCPLHVMYYNR
jgi:hypothetical protein